MVSSAPTAPSTWSTSAQFVISAARRPIAPSRMRPTRRWCRSPAPGSSGRSAGSAATNTRIAITTAITTITTTRTRALRLGARVSGRPPIGGLLTVLALAGVMATPPLVSPPAAVAATMCHTDGAATERLATLTARASARFLEASSEALLAVKSQEESSQALAEHRTRALALLDAATADYRQALALADDLPRGDEFLRARAFERLRAVLGVTPGTLNAVRWEHLVRSARESRTPTADLIGVCVAGAESLKVTMTELKPDTSPLMARRAAYAWFLVLTHGGLVSDVFDTSVE